MTPVDALLTDPEALARWVSEADATVDELKALDAPWVRLSDAIALIEGLAVENARLKEHKADWQGVAEMFHGDCTAIEAERDALRAEVARLSQLADERHDLLSAERRTVDSLRAERAGQEVCYREVCYRELQEREHALRAALTEARALLWETLALAEKLGAGHVNRVIDRPSGVGSADITALVPLRERVAALAAREPSR